MTKSNILDLSKLDKNHQKIIVGNYQEKGTPFVTVDFPFILNIPNIIHYRPEQANFPSATEIKTFLDESIESKILIITSNVDKSFPTAPYLDLLSHPKLQGIVTHNPSFLHPKIFSLPLGPKWQIKSTLPFGESKTDRRNIYLQNCACNCKSAFELFNNKRISQVWIRPMTQSVGISRNYNSNFSRALIYNRNQLVEVLQKVSKVVISKNRRATEEYLQTLQEYRFVISPHGNGLDAHSTWEALMCGCIPIVPSSPLNQIYELLPVWVVEDWTDITDEKIVEKEKELLERVKEKDFELIFETGLQKYIQNISEKNGP